MGTATITRGNTHQFNGNVPSTVGVRIETAYGGSSAYARISTQPVKMKVYKVTRRKCDITMKGDSAIHYEQWNGPGDAPRLTITWPVSGSEGKCEVI